MSLIVHVTALTLLLLMLGFIFVASKTKIASWYFPICTSWDLLNWEELDDLGQDAIQLQCLLFDSAVVFGLAKFKEQITKI